MPGFIMEKIQEKILKVDPSKALVSTLREMYRLEKLSIQNPSFIKFVFENFTGCLPCIPGKIYNYIRENFIYTPDEYDESIKAPHVLIRLKKGDCDDFALFAKTILDILGGWNNNYLLLGKTMEGFTHIAVFANRGRSILNYIDPVVIDGANSQFNVIDQKYINRKILK